MSVKGDTPVTWERWTIDEIDEGVVRVAVARTEYALDPAVAEAYFEQADAETLRQAVFEAEDAPPEHIWGDEEAVFLPVPELDKLLRQRTQVRGLPDRRPLREGDVFWVLLLSDDVAESTLRGVSSSELPARAAELKAEVWDVTAAARQAAKRSYDRAVRVAAPEPEV